MRLVRLIVIATGLITASALAQDASRTGQIVNYLERGVLGHRDGVRAVATLPDGKRFVSASADHTAKLWELSTGKLLRTYEGHTQMLRCVAVSADGNLFATGSRDSSVIVWETETGKVRCHLVGHSATVVGVAFLPDGKLSSIGADGLRVWDLETEKTVIKTPWSQGTIPFRVAYSADGTRAAILDNAGPTLLWDTAQCKLIERMPGGNFRDLLAVGLSPDGNIVIYPDRDGYAVVDVRNHNTTKIKKEIASESIGFSPDCKRVVVSDGAFANVWALDPLKAEFSLGASRITAVHGVVFARDGHHILAGIGGREAPTWTALPPNGVAIFDLDRKPATAITGPAGPKPPVN